MTVLRTACKCGITNDLDAIERGIGLRGSSFMDFDAVSHDTTTHRFLVRELKRPNDPLDKAVRIALMDVAHDPRWSAWYVRLENNGTIAWADMRWPDRIEGLSVDQYRARLAAWWSNRATLLPRANHTAAFDEPLQYGDAL